MLSDGKSCRQIRWMCIFPTPAKLSLAEAPVAAALRRQCGQPHSTRRPSARRLPHAPCSTSAHGPACPRASSLAPSWRPRRASW
ncbi:hypothetical protein T492DRAFT_474866 [Pavlovales sp. CCMP2436]|nr:hypothetical protein T492DRAFT_474866 [Pavlovales sp. CCMP2436]